MVGVLVCVVVALEVTVVVVVCVEVAVVVCDVDVMVEVGVVVNVNVAVVVPVKVAVEVAVDVAVVVGVLNEQLAKVPSANEVIALLRTLATCSQFLSLRINPEAVHFNVVFVLGVCASITFVMPVLALHSPDKSRTKVVPIFSTHSRFESAAPSDLAHPSMTSFNPMTCASHLPGCTDR